MAVTQAVTRLKLTIYIYFVFNGTVSVESVVTFLCSSYASYSDNEGDDNVPNNT